MVMFFKSTRFSGGGLVAEFFCGLRKPTRFSRGGGVVVAEFFRGLRKPTKADATAIQWGGGG